MKKTILIFALSFVFVAICFHSAFAYTEAECQNLGGACSSQSCGASASTIGSCWGTGDRVNCCGSATNAQQQIMGGTAATSPTTGGGTFGNPIGATSIEGVLGNIMSYLRGIAGVI